MQINEYLNNQKQIFWELLAATVLELDLYPDIAKGEFSFGANEKVLSFRNCGRGLPAGAIARAVLPETDGGLTDRHLSELYPLDALLELDLFELHSFRIHGMRRVSYNDEACSPSSHQTKVYNSQKSNSEIPPIDGKVTSSASVTRITTLKGVSPLGV